MINKADLHTHSTASDGTLTPRDVAKLAKAGGILAIALTDHDTVSGVPEFMAVCAKLGINGVSGVEVSADYKCEMHILGLFVDYTDKELIEKLKHLSNSRYERNLKMLERLNDYGFNITGEDIISQKDSGTLSDMGRAHFAIAMTRLGYVKDKNEAFSKYLGNGKCCYVGRVKYSPKECIDMIHSAGGIAILAHPILITRDEGGLRELFGSLKADGLDGVECYHSEYDKEFSALCLKLADEYNLIPSGGSDFHGENKPDVKIGVVNGDENVPYEVFENLKQYNSQRKG